MRRTPIRRGPDGPADGTNGTEAPADETSPVEQDHQAEAGDAGGEEKPGDKAAVEKAEDGAEDKSPKEGEEGAEEDKEKSAETNGEAKAEGGEEAGKKSKKTKDKKEDKDGANEGKAKKVKKSIPAWASLPSVKRTAGKTHMQHPKVDDILIEAIQSCKERSGVSVSVILKYIMNKYDFLELDKRKFLLKKSVKKLVEKGVIKQLKGKGLAGSFAIGKLSAASNAGNKKPTVAVAPGVKGETLADCLPLIMTRLCEPKEASYSLIKKYLTEHYPQMDVEKRPDILKNALQKAVERGQLEQITGKGACGTFQLKKNGDKPATILEDAIVTAIIAMNEPKSCSINTLRKHLIANHKDRKEHAVVLQMKRTLEKSKTMGWIEQITGHGLSGSYQLSYPYYPSPAILFPEKIAKQKKLEEERAKRKRMVTYESESEEESEEESDDDEDEPPRRRGSQKRPAPKGRSSAAQKKGKSKSGATKRSAPPAKRGAPPAKKKAAAPAKKPAAKKGKATPVKKAAPARTPKTPVAKKLTSRVGKRPAGKKTPAKAAAKAEDASKAKVTKSEVPAKAKPAAKGKAGARKSSRVKK